MGATLGILGLAGTALQIGSSLWNAHETRQNAKSEIKQLQLQQAQIERQRANLADQYVDKRTQLIGNVNAVAGHNGVRVSGSVANSLNESLTQMNIEEAQNDYNLQLDKQTSEMQEKNAKRTKKYAYLNGILQAGSTALQGISTYDKYWGSNAGTNQSPTKIINNYYGNKNG